MQVVFKTGFTIITHCIIYVYLLGYVLSSPDNTCESLLTGKLVGSHNKD